jgi:uncharacterized membrane protein
MSLDQVLLVAALVLEILAACGVSGRVNTMAAGLACYFATLVF